MADLRWKSDSGERRQYKTPKAYDYVQAVIGTGPIHSSNFASHPKSETGDSSRFVKSSKEAARGGGTLRILTRGKGTRETTRKKGAGERDTTRKGTAEMRRPGQGNNGARELNNSDPNLDHNLDPNLDPNLQHVGAQEYQQVLTGNLLNGTAPNAKDGPGWPQGTGWQEPKDIEDGNRRLNNPKYDDDGIIEDPPISENEDEHECGRGRTNNNDSHCLEEADQLFERPMMTKKVISSQSRGKTEKYDETLRFKDSDGAWVPAVYHESIRLDLIHKASLKGKYVHERGSSTTPGDITSYLESQRTWGTKRGGQRGPNNHKGNWPPILYQLKKPGNFSKADYPEAVTWKYNGRLVLSVHDSLPLRKYENLPDTISSKISGAELEAMLRSDPRVGTRDIKGRMPMYYITETGKRVLSFSPSTFSMRTHRFRAKHALLCWRERAGSSITNALILNYLKENEPRAFQEGDVEGIGPIPKTLEDAILGSNKKIPAVINRAGQKYMPDNKQSQPRPKAAPAPTIRPGDNRSRSSHGTGRTITDREQGPLEQNPTTTQRRLPQSAQPPGQPPAPSKPPRGWSRTKDLPPTAAPQPSGQQPPQASGPPRDEPKMKNNQGRALSQSPERQPPLKWPRIQNTQRRAPPLSPGQSLAQHRPLTRGHENYSSATILQPQQQETFEKLPAASIPPGPPRTKARTKYVPPPRPKTRENLRNNQSTSLTRQGDEHRGEREQESPAQPPVSMRTRSQQAARALSSPPLEQQPLPAPRPSSRVQGVNPPMAVPQPKHQQQVEEAGNRAPPKHRPKTK